MTTNVSCRTCSENLDNRDIVKNTIVCWKCGWKEILVLDDDSEDGEGVWTPILLSSWVLHD